MRQKLLSDGAKELSYEIREIVKKAEKIQALGMSIRWENIGDPVQKNTSMPSWMREKIAALLDDNQSYSYCPSKGVLKHRLETRLYFHIFLFFKIKPPALLSRLSNVPNSKNI